ncbi:MAG TPA: carbamoyltransferase HypF [Selenomonadales bacterium]|nr:carbamoyltransferase HypF [Selenomonadales bacterium]
MDRVAIGITGIVQGVGFRPFIYNLARRCGLAGWVRNDAGGVRIEAEGPEEALAAFVAGIRAEAPPLAQIDSLAVTRLPPDGGTGFEIRHSGSAAARVALVSPDVATCPDCRSEIKDPRNRRFGYPFTNCTNCGPRYTIIRDVPYDRERTTMAAFLMCPACRAEYDDPVDRRFHAQPNACPVCGPGYRLIDNQGRPGAGDPLATARKLILAGAIVAIKGVGGYHLACNAWNSRAVAALRARKVREDKPFAVMGGSLAAVRRLCRVSPEEASLLCGTVRPIVLLAKTGGYDLAPDVAPQNPCLGVMLPYAPVHWLLMDEDDVWVMTSGNRSDEPIAFADGEARERLADIADYLLVHDRPIYRPADDSVVRVFREAAYPLRRSRGYAPAPIRLARPGISVLACGGELKNTFCLTRDDLAFLSAHIGDLENMSTYEAYAAAIEHYQRLFAIRPAVLAHDLHPEYLSTKYARQTGLPLIGVQHHHAHIAAVLAEHGLNEPVLGVAFDGTGYGTDGRLWGGEFLLADCRDFTRLAHLAYLPLPGGAKAVREPWRPAVSMLHSLYGPGFVHKAIPLTRHLPEGWELLLQAGARGINTPLSSGAGRVFDIASALLGLRFYNHYEGQAAVELELAASRLTGKALPFAVAQDDLPQLDFRPTFAALVAGLERGDNPAELAAAFQAAFSRATVEMVRRLGRQTGIRKVALSGGVFQNITVLEQVVRGLEEDYTLLVHRQVPPNDGGLALGQAMVAMERSR